MELFVYILCALTSLTCATLLVRGYRRNPTKLLLWSAVCFAGLALNNILLMVDFSLGDLADLTVVRHLSVLGSMAALLYGLIWEVA
jgi:Family of unknown function (DUF5985)